jgi:hypothetical protein
MKPLYAAHKRPACSAAVCMLAEIVSVTVFCSSTAAAFDVTNVLTEAIASLMAYNAATTSRDIVRMPLISLAISSVAPFACLARF